MAETGTANPDAARPALAWLDPLKGIALAWIFLNHLAEHLFGSPLFMNPGAGWLDSDANWRQRLEQLRPMTGGGWLDLPANVLRYVGWCGDQGVELFLILSGIGLALGYARGRGPFDTPAFYRRRLLRLYPTWWGAHVLLLLFAIPLALPTGGMKAFGLSLLGLRLTPGTLYTPVPAWWFVPLLLQLYLLFPLLRALLLRLGPWRFLLLVLAVTLPLRALGLWWFSQHQQGYLDAWSRGAIGLTRLPEFAFGMALGHAWANAPERVEAALRAPRTLLAAALLYCLGLAASFTLLGMAPALLLLGAGALVLLLRLWPLLARAAPPFAALLRWAGAHSFSLYLVHHPLILHLVPQHGLRGVLLGTLLALLATPLLALGLEAGVALALRAVQRAQRTGGWLRLIATAGLAAAAVGALFLGSDQLIRRVAPREVPELGWGERASLQPSEPFGWQLQPSTTTRLRWDSYDYEVTSNALGFPGPQYAEAAAPGTIRIMTVGDAFTSAEGVDTDKAWPRLLEQTLRQRLPGRTVEVCNFAVTGYGPRQYAAVIDAFVPRLHPDLVLVGFFVNEFADVGMTDDEFRGSIGFDSMPLSSWRARLMPLHLRRWLQVEVVQPLRELLTGEPRQYGSFLSWASAFDRQGTVADAAVQRRVGDLLLRMRDTCRAQGAELELLLVPASIQVAGADELDYLPRGLQLRESERVDPDLPQRTTVQLAEPLGIRCVDLRPPLRAADGGTYQRRNMHWTAKGHRVVADFVAEELLQQGRLPPR